MADNFQDVAKQFVQFYYQQFDTDREQLAPLYRDTSMLTYESESMSGVVPIINKLKGLPFQRVKHEVATIDPMPGHADGGVLIQVTGAIFFDEEANPLKFVQTFHLMKEPSGNYYVSHDIFKLVF